MAWRPHSRAHANPQAPEAWGKCDRCQSVFLLRDLAWQKEWAGAKLFNKRLKVCGKCLDDPQPQLKDKRISIDGQPVRDPRPLSGASLEAGGPNVLPSVHVLIDEPRR